MRRRELPFGAEITPEGVRFRLWAPKARSVALLLDGVASPLPMQGGDKGWFALTTPAAGAGSRYRYVVDGTAVPDPASRFQPGDVHGSSEVIDPQGYAWGDGDWRGRPWEEIVLYELHVGSFTKEGSFAGVESRLDHLLRLGVTAVELMPLADFPGARNWGYDGVLPFAPEGVYGRPEDLKHLIDHCHRRGLAVFLDVVYNHFGPDGNYLGIYAPGFFTEKHHTPWGAAINFDSEGADVVRRFYVENALYWLEEFHFDGLRFDAVHAIIDDSPRSILTELAETIRARLPERPVHLVLENDRNEAWPLNRDGARVLLFDGQWNDDLHHALHVVATRDDAGYYADYADRPMDRLGRALAQGFAYQGEASAYRDGERRGEPSAHLPPTAFVSFIQNHDQIGNTAFGKRLSQVADPERLRLVAAIYLLSPQIPMLFMGEEWAAQQPFPFFCDFEPELAEKVREGRRREFARFPEFQDEAAQARIPDPGAAATFTSAKLDWQAVSRPPHAGWLAWYRDLLDLRRREIVPRLRGIPGGATRYAPVGAEGLTVSWRLGDGARLTLAANFAGAPLALPRPIRGRMLFSTRPDVAAEALPPQCVAFFLDEADADD